jgi:hypothetical protein
MSRGGWLVLVWLVVTWTAVPMHARGDVPPSPGVKRIGYSFSIENAEAYPGWAFLAHPCSHSDGVPMTPVEEVGKASTTLGSRWGGRPRIYAVKREIWDKVREQLRGNDISKAQIDAIPGILPSSVELKAPFEVSSEAPEDRIEDILTVERCDPGGLMVRPTKVQYRLSDGRTIVVPWRAGAERPPLPASEARRAGSAARLLGCGNCGLVGQPTEAPSWLALLAVLPLLVRRTGYRVPEVRFSLRRRRDGRAHLHDARCRCRATDAVQRSLVAPLGREIV